MRKIFKYLSFTFLIITALICFTVKTNVVAADYYSAVTASSGQSLFNQLTNTISNGYNTVSYDGLWTAYKTTDCKPGTNIIWDMYSNTNYQCGGSKQGGNYSGEGDSYNREHSVPKSWFNEKKPAYSDLFHLYPTDGYVNGKRSNFAFGEVGNATYTSTNGCKLGLSNFGGYSGTVFEPADEYKGDFARTYFYFATRYPGWAVSGDGAKIFSTSYPYMTTYGIKLMTKWHHEDPVSDKEIKRNEAVYSLQKNRNPYIDNPSWVDVIWENEYTPIVPTINEAKVNNVISLINALPSTITLDNKDAVNAANSAYLALTYQEKQAVTNYSKLKSALDTIDTLEGTPVTPVTPGGDDTPVIPEGDTAKITVISSHFSGTGLQTVTKNDFTCDGISITSATSEYIYGDGTGSSNGMRLASGKNSGLLTLKLDKSYEPKSIILEAYKYNLDEPNISLKFGSYSGNSAITNNQAIYSNINTSANEITITCGPKNRFELKSITLVYEETIDNSIDLSNVTTNLKLSTKYTLTNGNVTKVSADLIATAYIDKFSDEADYGFIYLRDDGSTIYKDIHEDELMYDFADIIDARIEFAEVIFKDDCYQLKANLGQLTDKTTVIAFVQIDGKLYLANQITYSVYEMIDYYLNNNMITDSVQKKVLEYIRNK